MSLEDSINKLADAINNLASAYGKQILHTTFSKPVAVEEPASEETKRPRGRPPGTTNKPKVEAPPPPPVTNDSDEADEFDAPAPEAAPREYTMDDVRKACLALRDHDGGDKTRALDVLKRIAGVTTVPDVKPVHYAEVVNECNKAMAS
jgi:hypothetical protein